MRERVKQEFIAILEKYGFEWNDRWEKAFTSLGNLADYLSGER